MLPHRSLRQTQPEHQPQCLCRSCLAIAGVLCHTSLRRVAVVVWHLHSAPTPPRTVLITVCGGVHWGGCWERRHGRRDTNTQMPSHLGCVCVCIGVSMYLWINNLYMYVCLYVGVHLSLRHHCGYPTRPSPQPS